MWKTQRRTANGWETDHCLPNEAHARAYWWALESMCCIAPMRLLNDKGEVVDEMNEEPTEKGSDDEQLQTG